MSAGRNHGSLLVCVAAVALVSGTVTASALAAVPEFGRCVKTAGGRFKTATCTVAAKPGEEKYEWQPGPGANSNFTLALKPTTIMYGQDPLERFVECTGGAGSGRVASATEVSNVMMSFSGCTSPLGTCTTAGQAAGVLVSNLLSGKLGFESISSESALKDKLALEYTNPSGNFIEFACGGVAVVVRGSVLHNFKANAFTTKYTEKFAHTGTVQKPDRFAGGPFQTLESSLGGGTFERDGFSATFLATYEEKIEASTVN